MKALTPLETAVGPVAILGAGSMGLQHLKALGQLHGTRCLVIPARRQRARELTGQGVCAIENLEEALKEGVTHCIVATDTSRHAADAISALEAGFEVLVEKPLASNSLEALKIYQVAEQTGKKVFVGCLLRFSESLGVFRQWLSKAGQIHRVHVECQSYLPDWRPLRPYQDSYSARKEEGGVLRDLIHEIDYAGWIFGWPRAVQARLSNLGRLGIDAEETADLFWTTPEKATVSIRLDYLTRSHRRRMQVSGERGSLTWEARAGTVTFEPAAGATEFFESSQKKEEMLLAQLNRFLASDQEKDPRLATCEEWVKALAICDAARRSSETKSQEEVLYP